MAQQVRALAVRGGADVDLQAKAVTGWIHSKADAVTDKDTSMRSATARLWPIMRLHLRAQHCPIALRTSSPPRVSAGVALMLLNTIMRLHHAPASCACIACIMRLHLITHGFVEWDARHGGHPGAEARAVDELAEGRHWAVRRRLQVVRLVEVEEVVAAGIEVRSQQLRAHGAQEVGLEDVTQHQVRERLASEELAALRRRRLVRKQSVIQHNLGLRERC